MQLNIAANLKSSLAPSCIGQLASIHTASGEKISKWRSNSKFAVAVIDLIMSEFVQIKANIKKQNKLTYRLPLPHKLSYIKPTVLSSKS